MLYVNDDSICSVSACELVHEGQLFYCLEHTLSSHISKKQILRVLVTVARPLLMKSSCDVFLRGT